ncbi:hypothetical protein [Streptomyces chattanoogensis]|uniref:Uncharacterized protein n=1 Tax=Streptomyces chattanoogensis TaxID=66876 RepID=A0A0N0XWQ0_9ACTN|nr:hypothetical protein [Streptomyces chattanoogensis]KPC62623.1 hypothetical protein ADL29_17840 [Streptomyces chattanoogensis]
MSLPLIRLAIGPTNGTAHHGVLLDTEPLTACATHSADLAPIAEHTAHSQCQSCARAWLILATPPHPGGEPDARPAVGTGASATAHRPIPGHLLGYCGKPLEVRRSSARRVCANCTRLSEALDRFRQRAGELVMPGGEPCHGDDSLLWTPRGRTNLVTGHHRNSVTGNAYCERQLAGPNPGAPNECAPCRLHWEEAEISRQTYTLPHMQAKAAEWANRTLDVFDDRASSLRSGDVYTLSGCAQTHFVVAMADRGRASHTDLLVYLPAEERIAEIRVRRERLVTIQRPIAEADSNPVPS